MRKRLLATQTIVESHVHIGHRISIGLVALSLSFLSLALGLALLSTPLPNAFFLAPFLSASLPSNSATAVTLTWTAPGNDGMIGQAARYDVRYATSPISETSFPNATTATGASDPGTPGTTETMTVTNLTPSTTYFFALKTYDAAGNVSSLSNVATKATATLAAGCVPTYSCGSWQACTGGKQARTCTVTNACETGLDKPVTSQPCGAVGGAEQGITNHIIVLGAGAGSVPNVRIINPTTRKVTKQFLAFDKKKKFGMNIAIGDLDGDHHAEIVIGSGPGDTPAVKIFNDRGVLLSTFNPYPTSKNSGVSVGVADVRGDGHQYIVTVPAQKSPANIRIYSYASSTKKVTTIAQGFVGKRTDMSGFALVAGSIDGNPLGSIILAPRRNAKTLSVYQLIGKTFKLQKTFSPYPIVMNSGYRLAIGDINGDGQGDIVVTGGTGYWSDVKVFDGLGHGIAHFLPASTTYLGGMDISTLDINNDGRDEVLTVPYGKADPVISAFRYNGVKKKFERLPMARVWPRTDRGGLRIGSA